MSLDNWSIANPRLWYRDDLANHPELIPLEGQTIDIADAAELSKVYTGSVLLTDKLNKMLDGKFTNPSVSVSVDNFEGLYTPAGLFDDPISVENVSHVTEQWLTGDSNLFRPHYVEFEFTEPTVLTEYWIIAAIGTQNHIDAPYPSPKHWLIYGENSNGSLDLLDEHTEDIDNWGYWNINTYKIASNKAYTKFKFIFTSWHPTEDEEAISTGLKRLYLFGRPADKFILPNIPSPDDAFVWVVPNKELNDE